jgi:hypothetical protein
MRHAGLLLLSCGNFKKKNHEVEDARCRKFPMLLLGFKFYNQCLCFELVHFDMCPVNLELSNFGIFLSA